MFKKINLLQSTCYLSSNFNAFFWLFIVLTVVRRSVSKINSKTNDTLISRKTQFANVNEIGIEGGNEQLYMYETEGYLNLGIDK